MNFFSRVLVGTHPKGEYQKLKVCPFKNGYILIFRGFLY